MENLTVLSEGQNVVTSRDLDARHSLGRIVKAGQPARITQVREWENRIEICWQNPTGSFARILVSPTDVS